MGELNPNEECQAVTMNGGGEEGESSSSVMVMSGASDSISIEEEGAIEVGFCGNGVLPAVNGSDEGEGMEMI